MNNLIVNNRNNNLNKNQIMMNQNQIPLNINKNPIKDNFNNYKSQNLNNLIEHNQMEKNNNLNLKNVKENIHQITNNLENKEMKQNSKAINDKEKGDIKFTDEEEELVECFKIFDENGDGFISAAELKHQMMTQGDKLTEEEANDMINEANVDKNGLINYREFVKILLNK